MPISYAVFKAVYLQNYFKWAVMLNYAIHSGLLLNFVWHLPLCRASLCTIMLPLHWSLKSCPTDQCSCVLMTWEIVRGANLKPWLIDKNKYRRHQKLNLESKAVLWSDILSSSSL